MPWFLVILFLGLTYGNVSDAKKHPSAAAVVGTVYCDTCFQRDFPMSSHIISGASVAVECKDGDSKPKFRKEAKTDEHGEFKVKLPFSVSKHVKRIKGCTVKLVSSSEPYCAVASAATSSSLRLKSRKQGEHIFSAGFFSFKPLRQPNLCNQKPRIQNSREIGSFKTAFPPNIDPTFPPPIQDPPTRGGVLPPLLPQLPELPLLPPLPRMPWQSPAPGRREKNSIKPQFSDRKVARPDTFPLPPLQPNPFQRPPIFPSPNPFTNPPSTPTLNPNLPPVQGLTPSPSPPPGLPSNFPWPPLPITPGPGTPPPASSKNSSP